MIDLYNKFKKQINTCPYQLYKGLNPPEFIIGNNLKYIKILNISNCQIDNRIKYIECINLRLKTIKLSDNFDNIFDIKSLRKINISVDNFPKYVDYGRFDNLNKIIEKISKLLYLESLIINGFPYIQVSMFRKLMETRNLKKFYFNNDKFQNSRSLLFSGKINNVLNDVIIYEYHDMIRYKS